MEIYFTYTCTMSEILVRVIRWGYLCGGWFLSDNTANRRRNQVVYGCYSLLLQPIKNELSIISIQLLLLKFPLWYSLITRVRSLLFLCGWMISGVIFRTFQIVFFITLSGIFGLLIIGCCPCYVSVLIFEMWCFRLLEKPHDVHLCLAH